MVPLLISLFQPFERLIVLTEPGVKPFENPGWNVDLDQAVLGFGLPDENARASDEHIALENRGARRSGRPCCQNFSAPFPPSESSMERSMAVPALFPVRERAKPAFLQGISTRPQKNLHFSGLFCGFSLRSLPGLAIVPYGPGFSESNGG
jgi:hypothetical protein